MENALLMLLKWCLLALVYLFFFRVLQATWFGSTTNVAVRRVASSGRSVSSGGRKQRISSANVSSAATVQRPSAVRPLQLVILEPQIEAGKQFQVLGEMTIGRAAGCNITLDDTFMSQLHARVVPDSTGSAVAVEDLGSTNGTYVNRQRVTAPTQAVSGDRLQFGGVVMELG